VKDTGTEVLWIVAGTPAGISLTNPKEIDPGIRAGYERAKTEAAKIKAFWG
jgi:NTE family protein